MKLPFLQRKIGTFVYEFKTSQWVPIIIITLVIWIFLAVEVSYMVHAVDDESFKVEKHPLPSAIIGVVIPSSLIGIIVYLGVKEK